MWGKFASVVQRLDERERRNQRKFRETPRMKCGFCGERRSECVCCEIATCHLPCRAGSAFCERHGGRVTCEGSLMTEFNLCQLCQGRVEWTKFHVCCNGMLCPGCHDYAHTINEQNKPVVPDYSGNYVIQASPVVPLVPSRSVDVVTGEIVEIVADEEGWEQAVPAVPCMECHVVATHHYCDLHVPDTDTEQAARPQQPQQLPLGEPVTAYIVIGVEKSGQVDAEITQAKLIVTPRYYGLFVVSGEAEDFVRQAYISVTHGIESIADAAVRPEHYDMDVDEVQAIMAEADEFVSQTYDRHTWYGDDQDRSLQIITQEVR